MSYETKNIRNVAVLGHSGEGKTTVCEAILFNAKATDRLGKISDGNTVMDFDEQEIARKNSISLSVASCEYDGIKFNLLDVPGIFDFEGEQVQALDAAGSALIVAGPWGNVSVGTEKAVEACEKAHIPMMIFINQVDKDNADIMGTISALEEMYGHKVVVVSLPIIDENRKMQGYIKVVEKKAFTFTGTGNPVEIPMPEDLVADVDKCYEALVEIAAENVEALLDKYFEGGELTLDEIKLGLRKGIASGSTIPVLGGAAAANKGIINLMKEMVKDLPEPTERFANSTIDSEGNISPFTIEEHGSCAIKIFKTIADPFVGKMNLFKVMRGYIKTGMTLTNMTSEKQEKVGAILLPQGKKQGQTDTLFAGDIGALSKLQNTNTGDTLSADGSIKFAPIKFPTPMMTMAVGADGGDEEKVIQGLYRLLEEDTTFTLEKNAETAQMLISGLGETHIDVICKKLKSKFGVLAKLENPKIAYRETIRKTVEAEGKHKKQSGGHGQYGHCKIRFEPCEEEFLFDTEIVGGSIPKQYVPAIEKGLRECVVNGVLAGYPVVGLKAVVYDGSYHDVDSSEMAFKLAASMAFKEGLKSAKPALLEPIYSYEITVPESSLGDIMGDMNKRRGRILGIDAEGNKQVIHAEAPMAEMFRYATDLKSMTQGRGKFTMAFERYEEAPSNVAEKIAKEQQE